ncbi:MAG: 5-methyltetrahydropteroyltriglutamate--homocysteine methyltransferase [Alphaproteobacteria bacterium]
MGLVTTTIGAYPKPKYFPIPDWFRKEGGPDTPHPTEGYVEVLRAMGDRAEALFRRGTREAVLDQVNAGIDVPTDGEIRRENYIHYQCRHLEGIDFRRLSEKPVRGGTYVAELPTITGPIRPRDHFLPHDWRVAQGFTERPVKITVPGPMTIADTLVDAFYDDERRLGADLAEALNAEVRALAEAGCRWIQVDEPVFARRPETALAFGFEHLERCFHGVPATVTRVVHMCCGYPAALDMEDYPKADPRAYFALADAVDAASVDAVSIEDAHRPNDLTLLGRFRKTTVILGVVAIAKRRVEPIEEIRARLDDALAHIEPERLIAAPDCGLGLLGRELALKKLNNLATAAHDLSV